LGIAKAVENNGFHAGTFFTGVAGSGLCSRTEDPGRLASWTFSAKMPDFPGNFD
jgi:hypothetical protein